MSGAVHRQLRTLLRSTRPRTLCSGAHLAVLHVYRLQPATVQPGTQPRLLFPEGRPRSAEESAAQLAEVCDRDEVVLMTESALTRLLGGDATPPALGDGSAGGAAPPPLLSAGDEEAAGTDGGGAASAAAADSPGASVSLTGEETLPAVLAAHSVALADAVAPSAAEPPDWSSTRAWRQGEPPPPTDAQLALLHAASDGDAEALERLLPQLQGTDVTAAMPPSGGSALHLAAASGDLRAVRLLLAAGGPVHARAKNGSTPLHWAAGGGHAAVVRELLRAGASPDTRSSTWFSTVRGDASGQTAAHWAAAGGHTEALDVLVSARPSSLLQEDERALSPAGAAAAAGHGWLQLALNRLEGERVVPVRVVREAVMQRPLSRDPASK